MHPDFRFPDDICERERVRIVGLSMDGHCIRALGDAMHKYIHGVGTTQPSLTCCSVVTEENVTDAVAYKTARKTNPHTSGRGNTDNLETLTIPQLLNRCHKARISPESIDTVDPEKLTADDLVNALRTRGGRKPQGGVLCVSSSRSVAVWAA
jgi:hypothetical protein